MVDNKYRKYRNITMKLFVYFIVTIEGCVVNKYEKIYMEFGAQYEVFEESKER